MAFCPEHREWDQNPPQFLSLSETTSISVTLIWEYPLGKTPCPVYQTSSSPDSLPNFRPKARRKPSLSKGGSPEESAKGMLGLITVIGSCGRLSFGPSGEVKRSNILVQHHVITHNMERFNKQTMFDTIQTEWVDMNCVQYPWNDGLIACLYDKGVGSKKLDTSLYEAEWKRWCYGQTCSWVWLFSPGFRQYATLHCSARSITDFL